MGSHRISRRLLVLCAAITPLAALLGCSDSSSQPDAEHLAATAAADAGIDRADVAAVVEGHVITQDQVDAYVDRILVSRGASDSTARKAYFDQTGYTPWDVRARALKSLVDETLIQVEAQRLGIEVDEATLRQRIESLSSRYPSLQSWIDALAHGGYTEQEYEDAVRMSLLTYAVRDAVITETDPTNEQIAQYTVVIAPTLVGRRSSHILLSSSDFETAVEVLNLIDEGIDFVELVHAYSIDGSAAQDGDMGWDCINTYSAVYQSALDLLDVGEVSPIVRSGFGYHIIKCTDRYDAPLNPDGSIDVSAIPADLMDYVKASIASTLKSQAFTTYLGNLEATATLAVFDADGQQVAPAEVGLATEVVEVVVGDLPEPPAGEDPLESDDLVDADPIGPAPLLPTDGPGV